MSLTRAEYEAYYAKELGETIAELRRRGYHSVRCVCADPDCPQWQAVAIPVDAAPADRERLLADLVRGTVQPFGED